MSKAQLFSDLTTRILSAIVLIAIGAAAFFIGVYAPPILFGIVGVILMWELLTIQGFDAKRAGLLAGLSAPLFVAMFFPKLPDATIFAFPVYVLGLAVLAQGGWVSRVLTLIASSMIMFAVVVLQTLSIPCSGFLCIQNINMIIFIILCVAATDIGGYFAGRMIGGPKLWPAVSPKKTWAGTIGGWVAALIVAVPFVEFYDDFGKGAEIYGAVVVIAIGAQIGDLFQSYLKRRAGVKDASALIPGHGGFYDRFDGVIGAVGALIIYLILIGF